MLRCWYQRHYGYISHATPCHNPEFLYSTKQNQDMSWYLVFGKCKFIRIAQIVFTSSICDRNSCIYCTVSFYSVLPEYLYPAYWCVFVSFNLASFLGLQWTSVNILPIDRGVIFGCQCEMESFDFRQCRNSNVDQLVFWWSELWKCITFFLNSGCNHISWVRCWIKIELLKIQIDLRWVLLLYWRIQT